MVENEAAVARAQATIQPDEPLAAPAVQFAERAVICNINREPPPLLFRTYHAPYQLNLPAPGEEYALTVIQWRKAYLDRGDYEPGRNETRSEYVIGAKEIAEDLCREINSNIVGARGLMGAASFWGVFVCAGERPTREELDEAQRKLKLVMSNLVQMGDIEWSRYHRYELVPDTCRMAARFLHLEKEWAYTDVSESAECPACGSKLPNPHVAICRACNAVLDREKAIQFGLIESTEPAADSEGEGESEGNGRKRRR